MGTRLNDSQSLRNRLTNLEELDDKRQSAPQHIEVFQRQRKITFDKRHKKRALQPSIMIQDAKKLDFLGKFEAVWLGRYIMREAFSTNSLQVETLNGESFLTHTTRSICKQYKA